MPAMQMLSDCLSDVMTMACNEELGNAPAAVRGGRTCICQADAEIRLNPTGSDGVVFIRSGMTSAKRLFFDFIPALMG